MFLEKPPNSEAREAAYAEDRKTEGFVSTRTRLWAWNPEADQLFGDLLDRVTEDGNGRLLKTLGLTAQLGGLGAVSTWTSPATWEIWGTPGVAQGESGLDPTK